MPLAKITRKIPLNKLSKTEVAELQTLLNKVHDCNLVVDGVYGKNTAKCFASFKNKYYQSLPQYVTSDIVKLLYKLSDTTRTQPSDPVARQIFRGEKYGGSIDLSTTCKYFSQRNNTRQPHRTCNSSSNAMYCDWVMRATGHEGLLDDEDYVKKVFTIGDTIYHGVQTDVLKRYYGIKSKWMTDRDYPFIVNLLKAGFVVPVNILHRGTLQKPRGGHVICLIGYKEGAGFEPYFIAHDPYGTLLSGYKNHNGAYSKIPAHVFKRRWQGGYRILA